MADTLLKCLEDVRTCREDPFEHYIGHEPPQMVEIWKYADSTTSVRSETASESSGLDATGGPLQEFCRRDAPTKEGIENLAGLKILLVPVHRMSSTNPSLSHTSDVMKEVFTAFSLSPASLTAFMQNAIQFAEFPVATSPGHTHSHTYHLCMRQWSLMWSFHEEQNMTTAVLFWVYGSWAEKIQDWTHHFLLSMRDWIGQEMFMMLLGSMVALTHMSKSLSEEEEEATKIERESRQHLRDHGSDQERTEGKDYGNISAAASWLAARTSRHRTRLYTVRRLHRRLMSEIPANNQNSNPTAQSCRVLSKSVEHLDSLADALDAQASRLIEQTSLQQSAIFNLIAQRDSAVSIDIAKTSRALAVEGKRDQNINIQIAKASKVISQRSKRDSSSMKAIAVVTMVFLPGTFVASHFAMPLFDWFDVYGKGVVNNLYGIYWAITIPLTLITCCYCWFKYRSNAQKQEEEDEKELMAMNHAMNWVPAMDVGEYQAVLPLNADDGHTSSAHGVYLSRRGSF